MKSVMLNAQEARAKAHNDLAVFHEVRDIEESILTASASGAYEVAVSTTSMTNTGAGLNTARDYYKAWIGAVPNRGYERQMATVIQYFFDLGYSIERRVNVNTGDTFTWYIYW